VTSIFAHHPTDRPPRDENWTAGATLSVIAHALLVAGLVWGVHWRSQSAPESASAELWASVPEAVAPAPTAPPPQPVAPPPPVPAPQPAPPPPPPVAAPQPPDIVTEQEKERKKQEQEQQQRQLEQEKLLQQKRDQDKADKAKAAQQAKLDAAKLQKQHDDYMKRVLGQMDAPADAVGRGARNAGPSATWAGKVAALINSHLVWQDSYAGIKPPEIKIAIGVDGTILGQQLVVSSGNPRYDDAVLRAVQATGSLPRDTDGRIPSSLLLDFNPNAAR